MDNKIVKPATDNKISTGRKIGIPALHQRLKQAPENQDVSAFPNRLALMLDGSGSMAGERINQLKDAVQAFLASCDFKDTAIALESFTGGGDRVRVPLTCFQPFLMTSIMGMTAKGGTPMADAMDYVLNTYSITRGIIVSDGHPAHDWECYELADKYKQAELPIDCVHIGDSPHGEDVLRKIAETTGGKYIKFTDVSAFTKSFKFLTPAFYAQLSDGSVSAEDLGATEIK